MKLLSFTISRLKVDTTEISRIFDIKPDPRAQLDNTRADGLTDFPLLSYNILSRNIERWLFSWIFIQLILIWQKRFLFRLWHFNRFISKQFYYAAICYFTDIPQMRESLILSRHLKAEIYCINDRREFSIIAFHTELVTHFANVQLWFSNRGSVTFKKMVKKHINRKNSWFIFINRCEVLFTSQLERLKMKIKFSIKLNLKKFIKLFFLISA